MLVADDFHWEAGGQEYRPALLVFFVFCEICEEQDSWWGSGFVGGLGTTRRVLSARRAFRSLLFVGDLSCTRSWTCDVLAQGSFLRMFQSTHASMNIHTLVSSPERSNKSSTAGGPPRAARMSSFQTRGTTPSPTQQSTRQTRKTTPSTCGRQFGLRLSRFRRMFTTSLVPKHTVTGYVVLHDEKKGNLASVQDHSTASSMTKDHEIFTRTGSLQ